VDFGDFVVDLGVDLGIGFWAADFGWILGWILEWILMRILVGFFAGFFCGGFSDFSGIGGGFLRRIFLGRIFWRRILFSITFATYSQNPPLLTSDSQNPPSRRISDFRIFKIHRCGGFPDFCNKKSTVEIEFFDELCFFGWIFSKSTQNPTQNPRRNSQSIVEANLRVLGSPNPGQSFGRGQSGPQATEVKMDPLGTLAAKTSLKFSKRL